MSDAMILTEIDQRVAYITLNNPRALNALSPEMLARIPICLEEAVSSGARAILITGRGRAFCAGAELGPTKNAHRDLGEVVDRFYNPLAMALSDVSVPVVSAVNGVAAGAGVALALGADIVVMARSSYLLLAFSKIGLVPDGGSTWLIARSAGRAKALEMALLGERMSADEALKAGLVTRIVADGDVLATARAIAQRLAAGPTLALAMIRQQVRLALECGFQATLSVEREHQRLAGFTHDFVEGANAFVEKREPSFNGQ